MSLHMQLWMASVYFNSGAGFHSGSVRSGPPFPLFWLSTSGTGVRLQSGNMPPAAQHQLTYSCPASANIQLPIRAMAVPSVCVFNCPNSFYAFDSQAGYLTDFPPQLYMH